MAEEESVTPPSPPPPPPAASSRWNPTKEQISLLESLYKQGVRTPTAEEIQQIAAKLQKYGKIEGKNVFYWFQNHKARQRQKQKQKNENCGQFCKVIRPKAAAPPPLPGVLCRPFCMPQYTGVRYYPAPPPVIFAGAPPAEESQPTLELFPLHPDREMRSVEK